MSEPVLTRNDARRRYELHADGQMVGYMEYTAQHGADGDPVNITHTEVLPQFGGKGYGSALAQRVLAELRADGKRVQASCEFMAGYIARHPR